MFYIKFEHDPGGGVNVTRLVPIHGNPTNVNLIRQKIKWDQYSPKFSNYIILQKPVYLSWLFLLSLGFANDVDVRGQFDTLSSFGRAHILFGLRILSRYLTAEFLEPQKLRKFLAGA